MTGAEADKIHSYYYNVADEIRNKLKEQYVEDLIEKISNPTWENLHRAKDSFIHLYILVSAEENKKTKR